MCKLIANFSKEYAEEPESCNFALPYSFATDEGEWLGSGSDRFISDVSCTETLSWLDINIFCFSVRFFTDITVTFL